jgi:hypothetical protein
LQPAKPPIIQQLYPEEDVSPWTLGGTQKYARLAIGGKENIPRDYEDPFSYLMGFPKKDWQEGRRKRAAYYDFDKWLKQPKPWTPKGILNGLFRKD